MYKIFNLLFIIFIFLFFFNIYKHYSSNTNIKNVNLNRSNIYTIVDAKISNLPILKNDTDNVIEFNDGFTNEIKNDKPRNFWNLLKFK